MVSKKIKVKAVVPVKASVDGIATMEKKSGGQRFEIS